MNVYSLNNKWRIICNWVYLLLLPTAFLGGALLVAVEQGPEFQLIDYLIITILIAFPVGYLWVFLRKATKEEWFAAEYKITPEIIVQMYPSGKRVVAKWKDLVHYHGYWKNFLFSDGTKINLPPDLFFERRVLRAACHANPCLPQLKGISEQLEPSRDLRSWIQRNIVFLILCLIAVLGVLAAIILRPESL